MTDEKQSCITASIKKKVQKTRSVHNTSNQYFLKFTENTSATKNLSELSGLSYILRSRYSPEFLKLSPSPTIT